MLVQRRDRRLRVADRLDRVQLGRVEVGCVDRRHLGVAKQRLRRRRKVGKPRADANDEIGILCDRIGGAVAGHAKPSEIERMGRRDRRLARLRLAERNTVLFAKLGDNLSRLAVFYSAAHD